MDPALDEPPRPAGRLIGRRGPSFEDAPTLGPVPDAAAAAAPPDEALPTTLGPYRVLGELARGGMGRIVRAHHPGLDRLVAIKLLHPGVSREPDARARFLLEARAAARLSRHPGIVQVHDVATDGERDFLVLDLVDGESLHARVARDGPLEPRVAAGLIEKVARAVGHAHHHGVLHRDLKPHNVLLDRATGEPLLTDFGLAKLVHSTASGGGTSKQRLGAPGAGQVDANLTLVGEIMGTPAYMAPEQIEPTRGPVGPHTDVWGLGAILFECLTGAPPFGGASPLEVFERVLTMPLRAPKGIPPALEAIVLRCLEKSPAARYRAADDVARELARFLAGSPVLGQVLVRRPGGVSVSGWRLALAVVLVAVAARLGTTRLRPALEALAAPEVGAAPTVSPPPAVAPPAPLLSPPTPHLSPPALPATLGLGVPPGSGLRLAPEPLHRESVARLAEEGYVDAMLAYGHALLTGELGAADPTGGRRWLERAADAGDPRAALLLGGLLQEGGAGLPCDTTEARRWLRRGAELGSTDAMALLAVRLLGDEAAASDREALRWLEAARAAGAAGARALLAELLGSDRAAVSDPARALALWQAEADAGSADAMFVLGAAHEMGHLGLARSIDQARPWYRRARDAGHAQARERLAALGE